MKKIAVRFDEEVRQFNAVLEPTDDQSEAMMQDLAEQQLDYGEEPRVTE